MDPYACRRFGQYVLSKVDPSESFLKALPQQADSLDILYPVSALTKSKETAYLGSLIAPARGTRSHLLLDCVITTLPNVPAGRATF